MNVKVHDLMVSNVLTAQRHHTVDHVRGIMERNRISALPVVDPDETPAGIVTATDLMGSLAPNTPISKVMTDRVLTVPEYDDVSTAARIMRNHHVHHVVVTNEGRISGIVSSFDLLRLVEDHRFTMKNAPTPSRRKQRRDAEA